MPVPTAATAVGPAGQTGLPAGGDPRATERRAYLWIPPNCKRVRGLIVGLQNMLEKPLFQSQEIRQAAADSGLGIVWISPGSEGNGTPLGLDFNPPDHAVALLHATLGRLAAVSGYREVADAPLLPVGHSAATPFVWGMGDADASRVFAVLPYKGWFPGHAPRSVPIFHVSSEWAEWGADWGNTWSRHDRPALLHMRAQGDDPLLGEFVDIGAGHFDVTPDSLHIIAVFIRKAAERRLPADAPADGAVVLKPIRPQDGWLIDAAKLGTPEGVPVPYSDYKGDRSEAYWYIDPDLARAVNAYMMARLRRKPQAIDFLVDGKPAPLEKNGFADLTPALLPDGVTFRLQAAYLDRPPTPNLFEGVTALGHSPAPIRLRVSTGGLEQVGPDTFRVHVDRGGLTRQGPPWEPWVMAFAPGDTSYRSADRPGHVWINMQNHDGEPQTIEFPAIPNPAQGARAVPLHATASSGLPVQYFVVSGPAIVRGAALELTKIPPRSRYPVAVTVAAYQWGGLGDRKVQSAGPVVREFQIEKR